MMTYIYTSLGVTIVLLLSFFIWRSRPFSDWTKHKAVIFDTSGKFSHYQKIKYFEKTFDSKKRTYNFHPESSSYFKVRNFLSSTKYYFYSINNPEPLKLSVVSNFVPKTALESDVYYEILHTDLIKKLNALANQGLLSLLKDPRIIGILVIIVIAVWYFSNGGIS